MVWAVALRLTVQKTHKLFSKDFARVAEKVEDQFWAEAQFVKKLRKEIRVCFLRLLRFLGS
jgi:hypothetical protein